MHIYNYTYIHKYIHTCVHVCLCVCMHWCGCVTGFMKMDPNHTCSVFISVF